MQSKPTAIRPFVHTGDSANIAFYAEREHPESYVWVESMYVVPMERVDGKIVRRDPSRKPYYSLTIYRSGEGEIARTQYTPSRSTGARLPERTIARLVRRAVGEAIPPAYTEHIGGYIMAALKHETRAA